MATSALTWSKLTGGENCKRGSTLGAKFILFC